jgi:hypothetical protein
MATATIPAPPVEVSPELPPMAGARLINNRWIIRHDGRWPQWRQLVRRQIPVYQTHRDGSAESGSVERIEVAYSWDSNPEPVIEQLMQELAPLEFDVRPSSALHDQLERGAEAGFGELVEAFSLAARVKERPAFKGAKLLGSCFVSRGAWKLLLHNEAAKALLTRHLAGDHGVLGNSTGIELTDDQKWCPFVWGHDVQNRAALDAGGLVTSIYAAVYEKTRGPEEVRIVTHLNTATVIYAPSRDAC